MRTDILQQARAIRASMDAAASALTDEQAAKAPRLYPTWVVGLTVKPGDRLYYPGTDKLYKVRDGKGHTTQSDWTPDVTPDLYSVVDVAHAGTLENPIPAARGMEYEYGKYYLDGEDSKTYLCQRTGEATGGTIVLQYMPHELIGNYFTEVNV